MSMLGLYLPGRSVLHRSRPGAKLAALLLAGLGAVFVDRPWQVGVVLAVVAALYAVAGLSVRVLLRQARPLLWMFALIGLFHVLVNGWERAVVVVGVLLGLVLLAGLVTLTTRTEDLLETLLWLVRPLRHVGVDPERVGLLVALSLRSVPVVVGIAEEVRDAQKARGLGASPRAFAVPLLVRSLRHADALGEALVARGVDD